MSQADWSQPFFVDSLTYGQEPFFAIDARNDSIYVIYDFLNFIRSTNEGLTWRDRFCIDGITYMYNDFKLQGDTLVIFFIGSGHVRQFYFSDNLGESWQGPRTLGSGPGHPISANYNHSLVSVCLMDYIEPYATNIYLKSSTDFGITWAEAESIWTYYDEFVFSNILYYFYDRPYILSSGYDGGLGYSTIKLLLTTDNGESWIAYDSLSEVGPVGEQWLDASDGGQMAIVYHDYNSWVQDSSKVFVCLSPDSGLSWSAPINMSLYYANYFPGISVSGDTVVVAWHKNFYPDTVGGGILVRRTYDFGQSWAAVEMVTEAEEGGRFPEITIDGQKIHLIYKTPDGLYYRRWEPESGVEEDIERPQWISLQSYPNPFNASTTISYSLPEQAEVTISIYNLLGQRVATVYEGAQESGGHTITWDARDFPSGVYFARLITRETEQSIKLVLLK